MERNGHDWKAEEDPLCGLYPCLDGVRARPRIQLPRRPAGGSRSLYPHCDGRSVGGIPFTRGPLAYLLRNRFYIGEVDFKGEICPAEHPPILDRDLFEAVQRKLFEQRNGHRTAATASAALLTGRIFDDRGNRMSPSHSRKGATRHRYYVSSALIQGRPQTAGSVARVPAAKIEAAIVGALRGHIGLDAPSDDAELIATRVHRIEVRRTEIAVTLLSHDHTCDDDAARSVLAVPWSKPPHRRRCDVIALEGGSPAEVHPIRADVRVKLVSAIARGRQWLSEIESGTATIEAIAKREACSKRHVQMTISLAFLAPSLVKAAVEGRLPRGIGVARQSNNLVDMIAKKNVDAKLKRLNPLTYKG
jgi:site-specific DNA recombinase